MEHDYLKRIQTFDTDSLPDLDEVVLGSLQFFTDFDIPAIDTETYQRPLVIGSGNAFRTGKILFRDTDAVFADEGNYQEKLNQTENIDAFYIISASGGKHATAIAKELHEKELPLFLVTNSVDAPAAEHISPENVLLFPHIREPYTYNTSTYMSMMFSVGKEKPSEILSFIEKKVAPNIPENLDRMEAFTFVLPTEFDVHKGLLQAKFDELFGPKLVGRAFTIEQIKHAKTVITSGLEFFVSIGVENDYYGEEENRLHIPLPNNCGPAAMMAIAYYVVGHIQKQHSPYFKDNISQYTEFATEIFGHKINPIVE